MRLLAETNGKRRVLDTSSLTASKIQKRIRRFEKKYRVELAAFARTLSCDSAEFSALGDLMEWEMLEKESRLRKGNQTKRRAVR